MKSVIFLYNRFSVVLIFALYVWLENNPTTKAASTIVKVVSAGIEGGGDAAAKEAGKQFTSTGIDVTTAMVGGAIGSKIKVPKAKPIKKQALDVKKNLNNGKNSVNVGTSEGVTHFDLDGATHKGVETPHVQKSYKNTNAKGETFINKDRKNVRPMNQQDIRTVKKVLKKKTTKWKLKRFGLIMILVKWGGMTLGYIN